MARFIGDGLIFRTARRSWPCVGNGAIETVRRHVGWEPEVTTEHGSYRYEITEDVPNERFARSADCFGTIEPGTPYIENINCVAAFQSGDRHCLACAREFLDIEESINRPVLG